MIRLLLWSFVGVVTGVIVGAACTAAVAGLTIWHAASTSQSIAVPLIVSVAVESGEVHAESGEGLLVPPVAVGLIGGATAACYSVATRPHYRQTWRPSR